MVLHWYRVHGEGGSLPYGIMSNMLKYYIIIWYLMFMFHFNAVLLTHARMNVYERVPDVLVHHSRTVHLLTEHPWRSSSSGCLTDSEPVHARSYAFKDEVHMVIYIYVYIMSINSESSLALMLWCCCHKCGIDALTWVYFNVCRLDLCCAREVELEVLLRVTTRLIPRCTTNDTANNSSQVDIWVWMSLV